MIHIKCGYTLEGSITKQIPLLLLSIEMVCYAIAQPACVIVPESLLGACKDETDGFLLPQGWKAKWQMIHRFKHHRMAQGKLGDTDTFPDMVPQMFPIHTQR